MSKPRLDWTEYTAPEIEDERDEHNMRVHHVTVETAGEYRTRTGVEYVRPGAILSETSQPDVYDVLPRGALDKTEYEYVSGRQPVEKPRKAVKRAEPVSAPAEPVVNPDDDSDDSEADETPIPVRRTKK